MTEQVMNKRKCFIITPIGGERSDIRDALDGLLKNVLEPVLLELGFEDKDITVAHQMKDSGSINTQLITRIIEDELCIVNLTGLNPNVMYELAIRHAVGKPVVIIAENGTKLPFDIIDQRTIFYNNTMLGAVQLKEALNDMIGNILTNPTQIDNPIIKIIKDNAILDEIKSDGREHSELAIVLNKLSNLEERIVNTEKRKGMLDFKKNNTIDWMLTYKGDIDFNNIKNSFWIPFEINRVNNINNNKEYEKVTVSFYSPISNEELKAFMSYIREQGVEIDRFVRIDMSMQV